MIEPLKIEIIRFAFKPTYTIGKWYFDNVYNFDTLEDTVRDLGDHGEGKIPEKTAIPKGNYKMMLTFWPKYNIWTPSLFNVPYFEGIRIHSGVNAEHTHGCVLVGKNTIVGKLTDSHAVFNDMMTYFQKGKWYEINIIEKR